MTAGLTDRGTERDEENVKVMMGGREREEGKEHRHRSVADIEEGEENKEHSITGVGHNKKLANLQGIANVLVYHIFSRNFTRKKVRTGRVEFPHACPRIHPHPAT